MWLFIGGAVVGCLLTVAVLMAVGYLMIGRQPIVGRVTLVPTGVGC